MALRLLALSRFAGNLLYVAAVIYAAIGAYILFARWRPNADSRRVRLLWILLLPPALFVTLWFCGRWIWTILLWFQFGDDGPYERHGSLASAGCALLVSTVCIVRLISGRSDFRYRLVCSAGTAALAALFSAVLACEFANPILGWTAEGAAENYLAKFGGKGSPFVAPDAKRRVVEESAADLVESPTRIRRFVLYFGDAPVQEVNVAPYGWWWWRLASSHPRTPITNLDWAVENWDTDRTEATKLLEGIVRDFPNSDASRWASETLTQLREDGTSVLPGWRIGTMRRLREEAIRRRADDQGD